MAVQQSRSTLTKPTALLLGEFVQQRTVFRDSGRPRCFRL
jgi:hypothetical protein